LNELIGKRGARNLLCYGKIISYDNPFYHILYNDNDEEDMDLTEVREVVHLPLGHLMPKTLVSPKSFVGQSMSKIFKFHGTVTGFENNLFHIKYDHGYEDDLDSEDLDLEEVRGFLKRN
jgi:hypothetical protein